ncbi:MAG: nuclear transport factor 2 family protein [Sphingomonadales bacterium]|nr:nuclear transport factor 2 family protein [Sphingomonadales bacterium]
MAAELSPERLARLERLADLEEVRACLLRFCRGMDRFDRDLYLSAFWPDAEMAAGPYVGDVAGCYDWAMPMHRDWQILTHHSILNNTVDFAGDSAHSETYYIFVARNPPLPGADKETLMLAGGRYVDRFERRGGEWKIALRTNVIEWSGDVPPVPLPFGDVPGIADNGVSARDKSDPSYARPLVNRRAPCNPGA